MLEDFRGHDPQPTVHERAWMDTNPLPIVARVVALASVAIVIGFTVSQALEDGQLPDTHVVAVSQ